MRGRPAKPHEQHEREGTLRPDRHPPLPVVVSDRGMPVEIRPESLTETQQDIWDFIVRALEGARVLQAADAPMLENFVVAVDLARQARADLNEHGIMIDEPKYNKEGEQVGSIRKRNPSFGAWKDAVAAAKSLAEHFGLTPSARARLGIQVVVGLSAAKQLERQIGVNPLDVLDNVDRDD